MDKFNRWWVWAWMLWIVEFLILEPIAFYNETILKRNDRPTLSSVLIKLFGVPKMIVSTTLVALFLIVHWQWVQDRLERLTRALRNRRRMNAH